MIKKKQVLIVNCYFDELRLPVRRRFKVPQAITPAYLAGAFSSRFCDIKLHNEQYLGPLIDRRLLSFPHMLVLTGLNAAFDRMLHVTALARTINPEVVVVAGGPAVRALPLYASRFFDYCCTGDIEQLKDVIGAVFGKEYVSDSLDEDGRLVPRFDLVNWMRFCGYVEASRNCYHRCNFCTLTGEDRAFQVYPVSYLRRQIEALGRRRRILFVDNNFGGIGHRLLQERFNLLKEVRESGLIRFWGAMVSADFFSPENLSMAKETGCITLFCGIESFDTRTLDRFGKPPARPQIEMIRHCLDQGIPFSYGLLLDITRRTVAEMTEEIEFILGTPEIPLPSYISLAVPMLRTPLFYGYLRENKILPNIKIRDLDSTTITLKPLDPLDRVVDFVRSIQTLSGFRQKVIRHLKGYMRIYGRHFTPDYLPFFLNAHYLLTIPNLPTVGPEILVTGKGRYRRTFVGSTEPLDRIYKPPFGINPEFAGHFRPTLLTDSRGCLNPELAPDLLGKRFEAGFIGNRKIESKNENFIAA